MLVDRTWYSSHIFMQKTLRGLSGIGFIAGMCRPHFSCAAVTFANKNLAIIGIAVAHHLGHNLGMTHDTILCVCSAGYNRCIMRHDNPPIAKFSNCSYSFFFGDMVYRRQMFAVHYIHKGHIFKEALWKWCCWRRRRVWLWIFSAVFKRCLLSDKLQSEFLGLSVLFGLCCKDCKFLPSGEMCRKECQWMWSSRVVQWIIPYVPRWCICRGWNSCNDISYCYEKRCNDAMHTVVGRFLAKQQRMQNDITATGK